MTGTWTILRRELGSYFNSPMAYVVAIAFMLLNSSLYVLDLWVVDQVSMRSFFEWVSWTACFLVPAITMRSWAEERRGATYELLLTLPLPSRDLVLGKFLGALLFYLFCLSGSLVVPVVLQLLSTEGLGPDWGQIVAGYLGTILTGALLVAIGLFVSNLCRDQIVAFIVTLVVVLGLKLVGFAPVASQLDSAFGGLGSWLREEVSFTMPHSRFVRGLVVVGDVLWLVAWTAVFLFLNAAGLVSRMRARARGLHAAGVVLGLAVATLLGGLLLPLGPRLDLTADRLYTVSEAAGVVLRQIPEGQPVRIKLYFSPKDEMPAAFATLERDVVEQLEELQRRADGRLQVDVVHLHADDAILRAVQEARAAAGEDAVATGAKGEVETRLLQEGVVPFRVRTGGLTGSETKVLYAALTLTHGADRKEMLPQLTPGVIATLEQDVVTRVHRLVHGRRPVVGLLAPIQAVDIPPQQMQLLAQLGIPLDQVAREQDDYRMAAALLSQADKYAVRRLRPEAEQPLPDDLDTLVVIRPEGLSERMAWEISRFLARGGAVILAVQSWESALRPTRQGAAVALQPVVTGVEAVLEPLGLAVPQQMVLAAESFPLTYSMGFMGGEVTVDFRWTFRLDASNFDQSSLAGGIGGFVLVDAASPVRVDEARVQELGLSRTDVLRTGPDAWTRDVPSYAVPADLNDPRPGEGPLALAVLLRGTFPAPEGPAPAWPSSRDGDDAGDEPPPVEPGESGLLVLGTANGLDDARIADPGGELGWAAALLGNAVDALSLDPVLLDLRARQPVSRPIRDLERSEIVAWQVVLVGLPALLYLLLGLARMVARRRRQERPWRPLAGGPAREGAA